MGSTSNEVKRRWNEKNYDRITIFVEKGVKKHLQDYASEHGFQSLNSFIKDCIKKGLS